MGLLVKEQCRVAVLALIYILEVSSISILTILDFGVDYRSYLDGDSQDSSRERSKGEN